MGIGGAQRRLTSGIARAVLIRPCRLWAGLVLAGLLSAGQAVAACRADQVELRWPGGQARFTVELAETEAARSQGLMHRERLARSAGMLFIYETPRRATFWMKNTLIPLDMIFMDDSGRVTRVHDRAIPHDLTGVDGGDGIRFVLEVNGGLAKRLGIEAGAEMRHPAVGAGAAWPCE